MFWTTGVWRKPQTIPTGHKSAGWVRNRSDGTVEALVSGDAAAVAAIIAWARHGPPSARVSHVAVELAKASSCDGFLERPSV